LVFENILKPKNQKTKKPKNQKTKKPKNQKMCAPLAQIVKTDNTGQPDWLFKIFNFC
jgi:hypothetical protein